MTLWAPDPEMPWLWRSPCPRCGAPCLSLVEYLGDPPCTCRSPGLVPHAARASLPRGTSSVRTRHAQPVQEAAAPVLRPAVRPGTLTPNRTAVALLRVGKDEGWSVEQVPRAVAVAGKDVESLALIFTRTERVRAAAVWAAGTGTYWPHALINSGTRGLRSVQVSVLAAWLSDGWVQETGLDRTATRG